MPPEKPSPKTDPKTKAPKDRPHQPDKALRPSEAPGDVPDFAEEFELSGTDKENWIHPTESNRYVL